jgi:enhancer of mRNA-decapping protein 3
MRAKWVVCMGAPKSGLLHANLTGVGAGWSLYVADIGISNTAWRKYGTRRRHGVEFAADWVVNLTFYDSA